MAAKSKYVLNPNPRLSANQLSEYLTASPTRRKTIVRDAKFPKRAVVARYDLAKSAMARFLCDPMRSQAIFVDAIADLHTRESKDGASDWIKEDCRLSVEAIDAFRKPYNKMGLGKVDCRAVLPGQPKLIVSGVDVSVAMDVTTHRPNKQGEDCVGGIILMLSKSEASTSARMDRCRTSAVLAVLFAEAHLTHAGKPDPKICFALDVFNGKLIPAPNTYKKKEDNITESCEEVALRWPTMAPPPDYDGPDV